MPSAPKGNKYTNRHAVEASERRKERIEEDKQKKEKAKEDAQWQLTDREDLKRAEKLEKQAMEEAERARRLAEKKEQLEKEEEETSSKVPKKVSKRQQQKDIYQLCRAYDKAREAIRKGPALEEGGATSSRHSSSDSPSAFNTDLTKPSEGSIEDKDRKENQMLDDGINDRNIGRRARVLYRAFYEEQVERLKEEQPSMRRTQYHNLIWDMWKHNPRNPFAQREEKRNQERLERERRWLEGEDDEEILSETP